MYFANFVLRFKISTNNCCIDMRCSELDKTPPHRIQCPTVQRRETHREPSVQPLSSNQLRLHAAFTSNTRWKFTCLTPHRTSILTHNLVHLYNVVGLNVSWYLMLQAPIAGRKISTWHHYSSHFTRKTTATGIGLFYYRRPRDYIIQLSAYTKT